MSLWMSTSSTVPLEMERVQLGKGYVGPGSRNIANIRDLTMPQPGPHVGVTLQHIMLLKLWKSA